MNHKKILFILRLSLGFIFLWAFFDKLFGLGFATAPERAWLTGASPTAGFLQFATRGPLVQYYQSLVGNQFIDWLFMLGLFGIGLGLIFGVMLRLVAGGGVILMLLMYLALLPPVNNPLLDEHIIYALLMVYIAVYPFENWWSRTKLVGKYPWLR